MLYADQDPSQTSTREAEAHVSQAGRATRPTCLWWENDRFCHHFLGVFQGGGARGIAYVGALLALRSRRCWFKSVAGSSAGAITATLIASGMTPEAIRDWSEKALKEIRPVGWRGWLAQKSQPANLGHFQTESLRLLIEKTLRKGIGRESKSDRDVTFAELFDATRIELNVVVLKAPDTPVILNAWSAPDCQVSYAVAASSAIPIVMTPQVLLSGKGIETTSRYAVDGGAWANYPVFAFKDPSARAFYGSPPLDKGDTIVGFILQDRGDQPDDCPRRSWPGRLTVAASTVGLVAVVGTVVVALGRVGLLVLRSGSEEVDPLTGLQLVALAGLTIIVGLLGRRLLAPAAGAVGRLLVRFYQEPVVIYYSAFSLAVVSLAFVAFLATWFWAWRSEGPYFLAIGLLYCVLTFAMALLCLRYGAAVIVTGLPAIQAAMRATTGVPEWVGTAREDHVIRVPVYCGINTTSFTTPPKTARRAILLAARDVRPQISALIMGSQPPHENEARSLSFLRTGAVPPERVAAEVAGLKDEADPRLASYWGLNFHSLTALPLFVMFAWFARIVIDPSCCVPGPASQFGKTVDIIVFALSALIAGSVPFVHGLWRSWTWKRPPEGVMRYVVPNALLSITLTFETAAIAIAAVASIVRRLTSVGSVERGLLRALVHPGSHHDVPGGLLVIIAVGIAVLVPLVTMGYRALATLRGDSLPNSP